MILRIIFEISILVVANRIGRPYHSQNRDLKYNRIISLSRLCIFS